MRVRIDEKLNIDTVLYKTPNTLLLGLRSNKSDIAFIVCEGTSMSVDDENHPCKWGKHLTIPGEKEYNLLEGDVITMYFPFECKGLQQAGEDLAYYINENMKRYKRIIIIGHSKAGVCIANMARMLTRKTVLIFVSAPFEGTKLADAEEVKKRVTKTEFGIYDKYFNQHPVDLDIIPNSYFLKEVADFSGVTQHACLNIVSECIGIHNVTDIMCKYIAFRMEYKHSDGIVSVASQKALSESYQMKTMEIDASHANSLKKVLEK